MQSSRLRQLNPVAESLVAAAETTARELRKKFRPRIRASRGAVLRPGLNTPLWNELSRSCLLHLNRYGEKAKLARLLGISRQRLHLLLTARSACADAERTLQLLTWLQSRQRGGSPA